MSRSGFRALLSFAIALAAGGALYVAAQPKVGEPSFAVRKVEQQVVLYRVHRGPYEKAGEAIGGLFALAGQKGITPQGPVGLAYLNNPARVSKEHYLTEIRIPVGREALKLAGTLGEMTDVKVIPAHEAAVAIKPEGQADPSPIYQGLTAWLFRQGCVGADSPCETFMSGAESGDYARMRTEIAIPILRLSRKQD